MPWVDQAGRSFSHVQQAHNSRERERERERERDREKETETETETDTQTDTQTHRQTDRHTQTDQLHQRQLPVAFVSLGFVAVLV